MKHIAAFKHSIGIIVLGIFGAITITAGVVGYHCLKSFSDDALVVRNNIMQTTVAPDFICETEQIEIGTTIETLSLNTIIPQSISRGKEIVMLCDDMINAAIERYQYQQLINSAQKRVRNNPGMLGVLIIPSVGINVPLYFVNFVGGTAQMQAIVDAANSCAYINGAIPGAILLADHQNQDFNGLSRVKIGTKGAIVTDDEVLNIVATTVMNGHNNGRVVDKNLNPVGAIAPYIAYTCQGHYYNIRIVGFSYC